MARRVGFGDDAETPRPRRRPALRPDDDAAGAEAEAGSAPAPEGKDSARKPAGPVARVVVALFLLAWLAGWSYGIWFAFTALAAVWTGAEGQIFDWAAVLFLATWLIGALVAWAFGVVIVVVLVFGKQSSPEERQARLERKLARLKARSGG